MNKYKTFKKITILILLLAIINTINGMEFCGTQKGFYINVSNKVYKIFEPIETLTGGFIQIDCN